MLKKIIILALLAYVATKLYTFILVLGVHKIIYNHHPGPCQILKGIENGSEDMERIPGDKVLITSGVRFLERGTIHYAGVKGRMFLFDFTQPDLGVRPVTIKNFPGEADMDPHGISVWVNKDTGEVSVFVVNHLLDSSVVELFTYNDHERALYHKETFGKSDANFRLLNDVVAVGPRQFYATNYLYTRSQVEIYLQRMWGSVLYHDGQNSQIASNESYLMANGINRSPDGRYIYMMHIAERELIIFSRNSDNTLTIKERTPLYTGMDNIIVDSDSGDVWMAGHPVGHKTLKYLKDPHNTVSPSQVLRLKVKDGSVQSITEVLMDDGKFFSGASVAVYQNNKLLVGSIATQTMVCDVTWVP